MLLPSPPQSSLTAVLLLLPTLTSSVTINCEHERVDGKSFNLQKLAGPHSISWVQNTPPSTTNTTFTLDICSALDRKGVPDRCPSGTRVCGIERVTDDDGTTVHKIIPIAGNFELSTGGNLNPKWTRLKSSPSSSDREKEGLRLEIGGGRYEGKEQKAVIELICSGKAMRRRDKKNKDEGENDGGKEEDGDAVDDGAGGSIRFDSYADVKNVEVLSIEWVTPHACEDAENDGEETGSGGHWGFFTWFIIVVFLATATYLIFGSWLNYNRYGARGWDLLPHGDTIRDVPYLMKDWGRKIMGTVQGGGGRGGYSAV